MKDRREKNVSVAAETAVLAAMLPQRMARSAGRDGDPLDELRSLCETAGAVVVDALIQYRDTPSAGTYMGKGKIQELAALVKAHRADAVIFENDLSPSQIRNIEEVVKCKVVDRSELILDIFAGRARTHESRLQVELAQLEYTYPRLTGLWTHLERIGAGAGPGIGARGPGEQQIEIDRRLVQKRKADLRRELVKVQQRKSRQVRQRNVDFFTVGIVGYTNAGKSTLFNTLTGADAYADNKLFDTVGFVRNLPHHLVASFRATLEESIHSDLLLIVLDVADPRAAEHLQTVERVLEEIGAQDPPRLLLLNKIDRLEDNSQLLLWQKTHTSAIPISAARGLGLDKLVEAVRHAQRGENVRLKLRLALSEGKALHTLENRAVIHGRQYNSDHVTLDLTLGSRQLAQLRASGARFEVVDATSDAPASRA
jgi:GTPase